jgi:hypothetical protein
VAAQEYLEGLGGAVAFAYRHGETTPWNEEMMRGERIACPRLKPPRGDAGPLFIEYPSECTPHRTNTLG